MRAAWVTFAGALGLVLAVAGAGHAQTAPGAAPTESTGPIPLAEVAARAAELRGLLDTQEAAVTPTREIQSILDALPGQAQQLQTGSSRRARSSKAVPRSRRSSSSAPAGRRRARGCAAGTRC